METIQRNPTVFQLKRVVWASMVGRGEKLKRAGGLDLGGRAGRGRRHSHGCLEEVCNGPFNMNLDLDA